MQAGWDAGVAGQPRGEIWKKQIVESVLHGTAACAKARAQRV